MRQILFILSLFLSCLFSGGCTPLQEHYERASSAIVEAAVQDDADGVHKFHSKAILPARTASFSGENGGYAPSVRSNNSVRRTHVSQKHPFRIIKAGKIIDRQNFFIFQTQLHQFPSGINSISRYIHTICQLLI